MNRPRTILAAALFLALSPFAQAHAPTVVRAGVPFDVPDATISRALYGEFLNGDEIFVARLSFPEDFALPVELFVPHRESLKSHRPAWALVGVGLPLPRDHERAALPRPLPTGAGAYVDLNRIDPRPAFYEFFTRRYFWSSGAVALVLPKGAYELWMWSPDRTTGKFGMGFGVEERIDFADALSGWNFYAY